MIKGSPRFGALTLGELRVRFLPDGAQAGGTPPVLSVKAAYVNVATGHTHGWVTGGGEYGQPVWSPRVRAKLKELQELLEIELAAVHFENAQQGEEVLEVEELGIGEHAGGREIETEQQ